MAKRGRKPKRRIQWAIYKTTLLSAISLGLLFLAVISALSIFAGIGEDSAAINSRLRNLLVTQFGFASIILPIILFYGGLMTIGTIHWRFLKYRILTGFIMLFIGFLGLFGSAMGGNIGGILSQKTATLISTPGSFFFYLIFSIFSVVIITNTGISVFIEKIVNTIQFIKIKIFRIQKDVDGELALDTEPELGLEQLELPEGEPGEGNQSVIDVDVVEEEPKPIDLEQTSEKVDDKTFEIITPPSGPVEGDKLWASDDESDVSLQEDEEIEEEPYTNDQYAEEDEEERTSVSRLPFSNKVWEYPPLDLLSSEVNQPGNAGNVQERANMIEETLKSFGVKAGISDVHVGPAVTQYALNLSVGTKASKIQSLSTDLALRLKSPSGSVRVVAPIPGTNLVGIEVPNFTPSTVSLRSVLESKELKSAKSKLAVALGHDVTGSAVVQDIGRWPHALIAGATGAGKSVMLNTIITTLLFRCSPSECRFIMIDPKLVELSPYNGIPHLLTPVVTDVEQKAVSAFAWAVHEMERRYKLFANAGVRNLDDYNKKSGFQAEPYIVIVVDEIADMMMVAASEVEKYIIRLAQKSRATGIHLILATQRPSVNIITGTIKANVPTRIAFKVTSNVDSRVIIDQAAAETLIGRGDMLFVPPDDSKPRRVQGAFVSDDETKRIVDYLKETGIEPEYKEEITEQVVPKGGGAGAAAPGEVDSKVQEAVELIIMDNKASASYLQRKLGIGYSRAARIIDDLEDAGVIGPARGSKPRDVLVASAEDAFGRLSPQDSDE